MIKSQDLFARREGYPSKRVNSSWRAIDSPGLQACIIKLMKKLLDSDWLRAVQFKFNASAKSVTPVQKV